MEKNLENYANELSIVSKENVKVREMLGKLKSLATIYSELKGKCEVTKEETFSTPVINIGTSKVECYKFFASLEGKIGNDKISCYLSLDADTETGSFHYISSINAFVLNKERVSIKKSYFPDEVKLEIEGPLDKSILFGLLERCKAKIKE